MGIRAEKLKNKAAQKRCDSCVYNDIRKCGVRMCILPRCVDEKVRKEIFDEQKQR